MKKSIIIALLISSTPIFAKKLQDYDQIKSAVLNGKTIHIVIDFSLCTSNEKTTPKNKGVFRPNTMQVMDHHIATSFRHFTLDNPAYPDKPLYEFVRYTIADTNKVKVTYQMLDVMNLSPLSRKMLFDCEIEVAAKFYT